MKERYLLGMVLVTSIVFSLNVWRIKGNGSARQLEAREELVETLLSDDFTKILEKRGLHRPEGFIPMKKGAR